MIKAFGNDLQREILRLAWPAILEMMLHMIVGIIDVAMVGRLGSVELTGAALGSKLFFSTIMVLATIGIGATALVARHIGAEEPLEAGKIAIQALELALFVGLLVSIIAFFFSENIAGIFALEAEPLLLATSYLRITGTATFIVLISFVGNAIFRGAGNTKLPLFIAIVANIINIIGNYLLIFGKYGFPALGVAGAAWATLIAQCVAALISIYFIARGKTAFKIKRDFLKVDWQAMKRVILLSIPAGLEELTFSSAILVSSYLIAKLGTDAFAAHQVALSVESLSFMPGYGFAIATTSLVGQKLGAKRIDLAKKVASEALLIGTFIMSAMGVLFLIFAKQLVGLFTEDVHVVTIAAVLIQIAALEQPTIAIEMILTGTLRGAGDTKNPLYVALVGNWLVRVPLLFVVISILNLDIAFVWIVTVIDWAIRSILVYYYYKKEHWLEINVA